MKYLCNERDDEYADEERVAVHAGEHVVLAVDFARTDLIEERHHDDTMTSRDARSDVIMTKALKMTVKC